MQLFKELVKIDPKARTAIYLQISNAIIQNIRQGRLKKGLKLPGSRQVAEILGVNRMTIVAAYDELEAQGWIIKLPRAGAFVKTDLPVLAPRKIIEGPEPFRMPQKPCFFYDEKRIEPVAIPDFPSPGKLIFNDGFPDTRLAPVNELIRSMRRLSHLPMHKKYLSYGGAQGTVFLRETLAEFLNHTRGLPITPENIRITRGAQMSIYIAASILIQPHDGVIVGTPGYMSANLCFQQLGAKMYYVPVDEGGINTNAIEKLCKKNTIKMVYVISHHHNPTTVTLTPQRRMHLLELAAAYKFAIIEDDYDYDFHYASKPLMPMVSMDKNGSVIYIGTLTKTLAPAIRIGFMIAPANFIRSATHLRKSLDTQGDSLMENAIADLYEDGTITRHIKKSVKIYKERRDNFCALLQKHLSTHIAYKIPDGGMCVWVKFLQRDLSAISEQVAKKGLVMKDGREYNTAKENHNSLRLGFASLDHKEQEKAIMILKEALAVLKSTSRI